MKFILGKNKNQKNTQIHGIDFNDATIIFDFPMLTCVDNRFDYGEERWVGIGFLKWIIAVIVYTEDDEKDIIRIISCRKATKNEIKKFKQTLGY